jgi:hypothetical protein
MDMTLFFRRLSQFDENNPNEFWTLSKNRVIPKRSKNSNRNGLIF